MRLLAYHLAACLISILAVRSSAEAQTEVTNAHSLASAKSISMINPALMGLERRRYLNSTTGDDFKSYAIRKTLT